MLSALVIVFREAIEAGLIIGIVLAATQGVARRAWYVALGVFGGVLGACLVAAFAGELASAFQDSGQELFNATILLLAVAMLTWHNVWMASHGRQMARELKAAGLEVAMGSRTLMALSIVVGVAVLREGSEVVLFLYGIAAQGVTSGAGLALGGALGLGAGAVVSALMYFGLLAIPAHRLFAVTSGLITLLAAGMAAQAVLFLQNGGYITVFFDSVWNTSWLLAEDSIPGKLLHTLIGYTDAPNLAQILAYLATIAMMWTLMRLVGRPAPKVPRPAPAE